MICTKCGNECGNSKFCPKCGHKLVRECKNCQTPLSENDVFCPKCGTENRDNEAKSASEIAGFTAFLVTIVLCGIKLIRLLTVRGAIHFAFNSFYFNIPYVAITAVFAVFLVAIIVFSTLFRTKGIKGFGIVAIVLAALLKVLFFYSFGFILILAGTIVHYISVEKK